MHNTDRSGTRSAKKGKYHSAGAGAAIIAALVICIIVSMMIGRYSISPAELVRLLCGKDSAADEPAAIVLNVRIARIAAAILIGAALSASGAAYQGIFRNPMVSPDILGSATGASFGAALAIYFGGSAFTVQVMAFCCGILSVSAAYFASRAITGEGGGATMTLVLTGMVVASLFSAFISIIKFVGDPYDTLPAITFWLMGGLTYVTQSDVLIMIIPFLAGMIPLFLLRWKLNVLSLDDEEASSLGIDTVRMRLVVIFCATLVSSSAVAVGGMIGWVGLIVPHIARMIAGPDYKRMLPCSAGVGALFLLITDDVARCVSAQEIPLGVLTAIIGAPFFLWLMIKGRRSFI